MRTHGRSDVEKTKKIWDRRASTYDAWYHTFQGAVEHHVDWQLLKAHLPDDRGAKILDAAGGTGRIALPLAEMGYSLTLCDVSLGMLGVARRKLLHLGLREKVRVLECDVCDLPFADQSFDLVLCWDMGAEATRELIRVAKVGGKVSVFLVNRWAAVMGLFHERPDSALALLQSRPSFVKDEEGMHRIMTAKEARELFTARGIRVVDVCAVCGWLEVLRIPQEAREARAWDKTFFRQTTELVSLLSREPSVRGMAKHLVLYGERT